MEYGREMIFMVEMPTDIRIQEDIGHLIDQYFVVGRDVDPDIRIPSPLRREFERAQAAKVRPWNDLRAEKRADEIAKEFLENDCYCNPINKKIRDYMVEYLGRPIKKWQRKESRVRIWNGGLWGKCRSWMWSRSRRRLRYPCP